MSTTLRRAIVAAVCASAALASSASSTPIVTLGTHFGLESLSANGSTTTVFSTNPGTLFYFGQPGLRLGLVTSDERFDLGADLELTTASSGGTTSTTTGVTFDGGVHFAKGLSASPYLGGYVGVQHFGQDSFLGEGSLRRYGGLVGVRYRVADGHGAVRTEGRLGVLDPGNGGDLATDLALRVGFELWFR